jgi:cytochrome c556
MNRLIALTTCGALVLGLTYAAVSAEKAEKKPLTVKAIMGKAHKGDDSILSKLKADMKEDKPDFAADAKLTKELVKLAGDLGKNKPPKGEVKNWKKLSAQYVKDAKALDTAVGKKNKKAAKKALSKLGKACGDCHEAHRAED